MAGLRLILGVDVEAGNESHSNRTLPGLLRCIDRLPEAQRPKLVRGDAGFGTAPVMAGLEARHIPYLFKLRLTKNGKEGRAGYRFTATGTFDRLLTGMKVINDGGGGQGS